ncbi:YbjN domain-containing protein [Haliangium sp.]|uniref:YbjN domain-containing protein n=1 Tax=Haliangium sp. TaxID=2663208 RepID=UPI003D1180F5
MSQDSNVDLKELLEQSGWMDQAVKVEESVYHLRWGSAELVIGITDHALAVFAPMFKELPSGKEAAFCYRLLQLNDTMGGVAGFALQPDGWIVLNAGRSVKGMDADEFKALVYTVGQFADTYDDQLFDEFYRSPMSGQHRLPTDMLPGEDDLGPDDPEDEDGATTEER